MNDFDDGTAMPLPSVPEMMPSRVLAEDVVLSLREMSGQAVTTLDDDLLLNEAARRFVAEYEKLEGMDPGYIEWDTLQMEEALKCEGPYIPHDEVVRNVYDMIKSMSENRDV